MASVNYLLLPANLNEIINNFAINWDEGIISKADIGSVILTYPSDVIEILDKYLIIKYLDTNNYRLASFVRVRDFIYGIYYTVTNIDLDNKILTTSNTPIDVSNGIFTLTKYIECYYEIPNNLIIINGFDGDILESNVQYSNQKHFFQYNMNSDNKVTLITNNVISMSKNLKNDCLSVKPTNFGLKPAKFRDILKQVFINFIRISINVNGGTYTSIFSKCNLTEEQQKEIIYPSGLIPLDYFVYFQQYNPNNPESNFSQIVSFAKDNNNVIYGLYYDINLTIIDENTLINSSVPINLDASLNLKDSGYFESYITLNKTVIINGLSVVESGSSIQHSYKNKLYFSYLDNNSFINDNYSEFNPNIIIGKSINLI